MTEIDAVSSWRQAAADDWGVATQLFESGKYAHCLFLVHLTLEKTLKGLHQYLKHEPAPPLHDLYKLAKRSGIGVDDKLQNDLDEVTTFNISARYDDYKRTFYHKATQAYAKIWFEKAKTIYLDFEQMFV